VGDRRAHRRGDAGRRRANRRRVDTTTLRGPRGERPKPGRDAQFQGAEFQRPESNSRVFKQA
ncbi:hypothetical protein U2366_17245, partial [Achromobacter xylosoxidans]|uniref:hypothetical protein n=1 Tax=Alcaligenes xylosoxydans xylosoxydans TaxID=85698 RepID=UPI002ACA6859